MSDTETTRLADCLRKINRLDVPDSIKIELRGLEMKASRIWSKVNDPTTSNDQAHALLCCLEAIEVRQAKLIMRNRKAVRS